tara:strand:+ start:1021 stop:1803 length:783 start_codon:yes stop_codon:yes gene_type:complete
MVLPNVKKQNQKKFKNILGRKKEGKLRPSIPKDKLITKPEQETEIRNPNTYYQPGFKIEDREHKDNSLLKDTLLINGEYRDANGCIKGEEKYNIETKQCEKQKLDYRLYNLNQNTDIISEEKNFMDESQIDEKLVDSELIVDDELAMEEIDDKINNYKSDIINPSSPFIEPDTVESKVPKIDVHGCSPNGNPPTFYCENSGKCENKNSYNFKNNLCKKEDKEKYNDNKESYYFKITILIVVVLIAIIGMVYFLNQKLDIR